jgi:site-specific DNA recombinase
MNKMSNKEVLKHFRNLSDQYNSKRAELDDDVLGFERLSKSVNATNTINFKEGAENRYAIHQRVSTSRQVEEGESLETQETQALKIVEKNNGEVYEYYKEEGVSASKKRLHERPEMLQLLKDFQKGHFKNIISYNQDRLFRNDKEAPIILQILIENGANIYYTRGGSVKLVNKEQLGTIGMIEIQLDAKKAKEESQATSERVADNRKELFDKGHIVQSYIPYGYRKDKEGKVHFIEEEIEMIKQIEKFYLDGIGYSVIAKWLNGEKTRKIGQRAIKFPRRKIRKDDSENWTKETVEGMLFNKFYHGIITNNYRGQEIEERESIDHIPFRTKERYEELVNFKEEKKKKKLPPRHYDSDFLLKGMLYCKHCNKILYGVGAKVKSSAYYICKSIQDGARLGTHLCDNKNYNQSMIETFILLKIKNYLSKFDLSLFTEDMTKSVNKEDKKKILEVDECDKEISKLEKEVKGLKRDIRMTNAEIMEAEEENNESLKEELEADLKEAKNDLRDLKKKIEEFQEARSQLVDEIDNDKETIKDATHIFNKMREFVDDFENIVDYRKKRLIEQIVDKIYIDKEGNVEIHYLVDLEELVKSATELAVASQNAFYGGVGELTTPKNVHIENADKPLYIKDLDHIDDSNYTHWIEEIYIEARSKFKEFLIGTTLKYTENGRINAWQLANKTGISHYSAKAYFNYSHFPTEEMMIRVLKPFNTTPEDFVKYLNLDNYIDSNLFFGIMACVSRWVKSETINESIIGEEIKRRVDKYKEKNTLNRQVIYSTRNVIVEEWVTTNG